MLASLNSLVGYLPNSKDGAGDDEAGWRRRWYGGREGSAARPTRGRRRPRGAYSIMRLIGEKY